MAKVRTNRLALQKVNLLVLICGQNFRSKRLHILILWKWTCFILPSSYVTAKPFALHLVLRPVRTRSLENHEGILSFLRTHKSGTEESWTFFLWDKIRDSNAAWVFPVNWLLHFVIRFDCFLPGSLKFITRSNSPSFYFLFFFGSMKTPWLWCRNSYVRIFPNRTALHKINTGWLLRQRLLVVFGLLSCVCQIV